MAGLRVKLILFAVTATLTSWAQAGNLVVDDDSIFAVVTHKSGFTSLGHNHLVVAQGFQADLTMDPEDLTKTTLTLEFATAELNVDDPKHAANIFPHIKASGILAEAFSEQSESNRAKISKSMFSNKQLDPTHFPKISAQITAIKVAPTQLGTRSYSHQLEVTLTLREITKTIRFNGTLKNEAGVFTLEALGAAKFTDFGIKPYSAMFGAVSLTDEFHIFVKLSAK